MATSTPIVSVSGEDGPTEIVFQPPTNGEKVVKLKLRNKCNRLVLFRVRIEGADVQHYRVAPTDVGILSPQDTQPFEVAVLVGADQAAKNHFFVETSFVVEKKGPQEKAQKSVLDSSEMWKGIGENQSTKRLIGIRFDPTVNPADDKTTVQVHVTDPGDTSWAMNLRAWEIYGYAKSQNPNETATLLKYVIWFAAICFTVGLLLGLKFG